MMTIYNFDENDFFFLAGDYSYVCKTVDLGRNTGDPTKTDSGRKRRTLFTYLLYVCMYVCTTDGGHLDVLLHTPRKNKATPCTTENTHTYK